ncbi:trypsin-like serine peptidase [Actinomadura kijaniata]|uniref:trypsin-like serine peptidase n=1 Tax=Actinomadura kijaniata TaxID=46161 RepID=UPI000A92F4C8|nr:hypothetical protein [Actinomadura kijaniata]
MRLPSPRLLIAGSALGAVAVASGVAVAATSDSKPEQAASVGAQTTADPDARAEIFKLPQDSTAVERFWTPAAIRAAEHRQPRAAAFPAAAPQIKALNDGPSLQGAPALPEDSAEPLSAQSAGVSAKAVTTARQWTRHGKPPARTVGKLFFADEKGNKYSCSAAVITAKNKRTVWTAGHCVHKGKGGEKGYYRNFLFRPDYKDGKSYGKWYADSIVALSGWKTKGDARYDIAAFTVKKYRGKGIQYYTGSQGYAFNYKGRKYSSYSFGYPARALPSKKPMNSNRLWYCSGKTFAVNYGGGSTGLGLKCTMGNGASGGPWIAGMKKNGLGLIFGVNSMHNLKNLNMYSPYHGSAAVSVYKKISG